ncbi:uncharacterized protein OCT59_029824 [Rhizophagus irregularis]|uniref:uncharacterized protein n=1 Tax=Rhizophagus irregularis TaxID=588596 RepID=UPI00332D29FE|nr:hypothetical protein OCT59_029824 [Rhizophagus irregularis]
METISPDKIIEWIPYNKLENIKYLTKGGCSEIYTADWIDGRYEEWDSKEKQLKRFGAHEVVLKKLENIENTNRNWLDETRSHFAINNKYGSVVQCYGLTKDQSNQSNQSNQPNESNENYILVMNRMKMNLREYLQQNLVLVKYTFLEKCQNQGISLKSTEEREAYYSNQQDFVIPDSRYIFGRQTENNDSTDKNVKGESKRIYSNNNLDSEKFKKIKLSEDEETQFDNKGEFNYIREHYITNTTNDDMNIDDGDDTYNNPNLHSEEQDELEIFED